MHIIFALIRPINCLSVPQMKAVFSSKCLQCITQTVLVAWWSDRCCLIHISDRVDHGYVTTHISLMLYVYD